MTEWISAIWPLGTVKPMTAIGRPAAPLTRVGRTSAQGLGEHEGLPGHGGSTGQDH
jgi:hypothetical protein